MLYHISDDSEGVGRLKGIIPLGSASAFTSLESARGRLCLALLIINDRMVLVLKGGKYLLLYGVIPRIFICTS